jgi:hypothetical protein
MLSLEKDGQPYLSFWDAQDHLRASLGVWLGEPGLNLFDAQGKMRASLNGSTVLFGKDGKYIWRVPSAVSPSAAEPREPLNKRGIVQSEM